MDEAKKQAEKAVKALEKSRVEEADIRARLQETSHMLKEMAHGEFVAKQMVTECEARMPSRSKALEHVGQHENKVDTEHKFVCDCGNSYSKMTSIRFHYPCPEALKKFIQSVQSVATKYSASTSEIAEALSFTTNVDEDI